MDCTVQWGALVERRPDPLHVLTPTTAFDAAVAAVMRAQRTAQRAGGQLQWTRHNLRPGPAPHQHPVGAVPLIHLVIVNTGQGDFGMTDLCAELNNLDDSIVTWSNLDAANAVHVPMAVGTCGAISGALSRIIPAAASGSTSVKGSWP